MDKLKERIELLISTKGMTNAVFAESIGVQPSNISHSLLGRNKPSLDLVNKILERFKEVRTEWIINGTGPMTRDYSLFDENEPPAQPSMARRPAPEMTRPVSQPETTEISQPADAKKIDEEWEKVENEEGTISKRPVEQTQKYHAEKPTMGIPGREIEKIVIFYNDKTFTVYSPQN